jgi:ribosomal protein L37AE/L43A
MKAPSHTTSRPNYIVCPTCGSGELQPQGPHSARCAYCDLSVEGEVLRTLEQIAALPDALGAHVCECGHPEMRRLPDGVFHCPACGSEVLPLKGRSMGGSTVFPAGGAGKTVRDRS